LPPGAHPLCRSGAGPESRTIAAAEIAAWLRALGLEGYEPTPRANDLEADVLPELSEASAAGAAHGVKDTRRVECGVEEIRPR
jgi:hypothetical protein